MQAIHATSDKNMAQDSLEPNRMLSAYAWAWINFLNANVLIETGSDFPVEHPPLFLGLHASLLPYRPTYNH